MKSEEFEHLVEGATESQRLDFKGPCNWDVTKFAKDILALSNLRDGGEIIIGINQSENAIIREGITGLTFQKQSVDSLEEVIRQFENRTFSGDVCRKNAQRFGKKRFQKEFFSYVNETYRRFQTIMTR